MDQATLILTKEKPRLLNLQKAARLELTKRNLQDVRAAVKLVLDGSYSMHERYLQGVVQKVLDRVATLALNFDDNGELDCYAYADGARKLANVKLSNLDDFIQRATVGGGDGDVVAPTPSKKWSFSLSSLTSLLGGGGSSSLYSGEGIFPGLGYQNNEPPVMRQLIADSEGSTEPTYVIFVTDGGIDKDVAIQRLLIEASHRPIFWQFVGIGGSNYGVLERFDSMPGRFIDNANFFAIDDLETVSDAELYSRMLQEFPSYLLKARAAGLIS